MMTAVFYAYDFVATNPYIRHMFTGMQAAVCAFIVSIAVDNIRAITRRDGRVFLMLVFAAGFVAIRTLGISVLVTMVVAAIASVAYFRLAGYGKKDEGADGKTIDTDTASAGRASHDRGGNDA